MGYWAIFCVRQKTTGPSSLIPLGGGQGVTDLYYCSLGLASGHGNKKVGGLFLWYWEIPSLTQLKLWNRGWDGWDLAVATAVGKLGNQQRPYLWKTAWGSLLGLCWVSTFPVLWWERTDLSFFLPPFFLFLPIFLSLFFSFLPGHFLWQASPLPGQGVWERKKKKQVTHHVVSQLLYPLAGTRSSFQLSDLSLLSIRYSPGYIIILRRNREKWVCTFS